MHALGEVSGRGRAGRAVLSAVTAAWLAALLVAGLSRTHGTWPVSRSSMFSEGATTLVQPRLEGTTADGRTVALTAGGLGLTAPQLRNWLARRTAPSVDRADRPVLRVVAAAWNRRHPGDRVVAVRLWRRAVPLPAGRRPAEERLLLAWRRSP